ncbi:MAG: hypothetical protein JOZ83_10365 [Silvibacterium sp.]|nr:hypothetical protein [Silvibacterium sp.]
MPSTAGRLLTRLVVPTIILGATCSVSSTQEVIHAITGIANKVDSSAHTITLTSSDGTQTVMQDETKQHPRYDFDKTLRASATNCSAFDKPGDRVIVYYFGCGLERRAVAVKDLGQTSLKLATGTVTHWDRHHHAVTIKAADHTTQTFQLDDKTTVDTPMGVVNGDKFDPQNGDQVSIKYLDKGGNNQAVFTQ